MQDKKLEKLEEGLQIKAYVYHGDPDAPIEIIDDKEPYQLAELFEQHGPGELTYALRRAYNANVPEHDAVKYAIKVLRNRGQQKSAAEPTGKMAVKAEAWTWAQIPNEIITDADVGHLAMRVWCLLRTYAKSDGTEAYPNQKRLAEQLQVSSRSIIRSLKSLTEIGWLSVETRPCHGGGGRYYNVYTLHQTRK